MNILVCIKQVCTSGIIIGDGDRGQWGVLKNNSKFAISRFDEYALEAAIQIKDAYNAALDSSDDSPTSTSISVASASVDVLSMGPDRVRESIRRAMGMGADRGIHLRLDDRNNVGVGPNVDRNMDVGGEGPNDEDAPYSNAGYVSGSVTAGYIADFLKLQPPEFFEYLQLSDNNPSRQACFEGQPHNRKNIPYDLVLTGIMSEDLMQAQVGPMLAEYLAVPCITSVVDIRHPWEDVEEGRTRQNENKQKGNKQSSGKQLDTMGLTLHRELEGGLRQEVSAGFPMMLTIQAGINHPRYPSFSNLLKAKKKEIFSYSIDEIERQKDSLQREELKMKRGTLSKGIRPVRLEHPENKRNGTVLQGPIDEKADELLEILQGRGLI